MSLRQWMWGGVVLLVACWWSSSVSAQGNFEIQVYGSETLAPGKTMFEIHITGCEFSAAQELLVLAKVEGSSIREWWGQKNAQDSGA